MISSNEKERRFNWSVTGILETSISSSDLWDIISSPSNLELFHPFCAKNKIIKWPGLNSIDQIYYYSGLVFERKFIKWVDKRGYDLLIGEKNEAQSLVSWQINDKDNSSILKVSIYPHLCNQGLKVFNFLPFYLVVKPSLKHYIDSVMLGLEYYIKTNKKEIKNQFGNHKIFSN